MGLLKGAMEAFRYCWELFCFAIRGAWGSCQLAAAILALIGGYIVYKHPKWGGTMKNLFWMVPLGIFIVLFVIRLILAIIKSPPDEIYKQPLTTGTAIVQWTAESNRNVGVQLLLGSITLEKEKEIFLKMNSVGHTVSKRSGNDFISYTASFELDVMDNSIGKPIYYLAQAQLARIHLEYLIKMMMSQKSKIISGVVVFTFNSSVRIEIPIPFQVIDRDEIIIPKIGKYFKKAL